MYIVYARVPIYCATYISCIYMHLIYNTKNKNAHDTGKRRTVNIYIECMLMYSTYMR